MQSYRDEQGGRDTAKTQEQNHTYTTEEEKLEQEQQEQQKSTKKAVRAVTQDTSSTDGSKGGLFTRLRRALFGGDSSAGPKPKKALLTGTASGGGTGIFKNILSKAAKPKVLAAILAATGIGSFSILGIFTTYKNDGTIRNDPPLRCEQGVVELPSGGEGDDQDIQENVNILYDIFVNEFGYSESALVGMLSCMMVESNVNSDRLESDYILTSEKEAFDAVAGPETVPGTDVTLDAFFTYADAFRSGGGYNGNDDGYVLDSGPYSGHMTCGIGLIQWTKGRAVTLIEGLDKVSMDVNVMDLHYQAAYLLAEMKTNPAYAACSPEGGEFLSVGDDVQATEMFFTTMVSGGSTKDLDKRTANVPAMREYVNNAAANSEFTQDTVTMAEILADDGFSSAVSKSNKIQLCVNNTYIDTSDIAKAAVSISFLERGEYEDVHGAYGMYRRAARSPVIINDWNYVEGKDEVPNDRMTGVTTSEKYSDHGATDERKNLKYYSNTSTTYSGKLDLIACTEYYYFAHLIAFPKETGLGSAGYFSSCDRGTATAVRIAGADDKFPAGNPLYQLAHATGAAKAGAQHDPDRRGPQGNGFLWEFAGFLRGCDYYPASASPSIAAGTVMISWNERAANGLLGETQSGGTTGAVGEDGGVEGEDVDNPEATEDDPDFDANDAMMIANLRWPRSVSNTTRHIITFVGEGTVQGFWGMDFLFQQWNLFDDTDRLIRGDLTVKMPELMLNGLSYKSSTAKKSSDQKQTFWQQEMKGAKTLDDRQEDEATGRELSFNAKTGLPTFKAWEQIFVRLIHNSDDDASAGTASGDDLYIEYELDEDNYLDDADDPDQIEQFQGQKTTSDKSWLEDWNSVGAGEVEGGGDGDYDFVDPEDLPYADKNEDVWTKYGKWTSPNYFWRYELITDIEYRTNQLLRFGMASYMCSLPSEEDADVFQTGPEGNDAGHIIGNIYRRYSRIPDDTDVSGRYYYYNNVISNDMLQDLTQLWTHERNGDKDDYTARNFGPMYLFYKAGPLMDYHSLMTSRTDGWLDRRYGLAAADIEAIMGGMQGVSMGAGGDAISEALGNVINKPMHKLSEAQLALYDKDQDSNDEAYTDGRGAHESEHQYGEDFYENDVYGVNPFLMIDEALAENGNDAYGKYKWEQEDWSEGEKAGSTRKKLDTEVKESVDGSYEEEDERLAWIDRHYVRNAYGNISMIAYQIAGLNPSPGILTTEAAYEGTLKDITTIYAGATTGTGEGTRDEHTGSLEGSWGEVRYTDFVYGENESDNQEMAKRLFGKDNRQGDGSTVRDDYNRREYIVIPYYHTHAQMCDHRELADFPFYTLKCDWWNNDPKCTNPDTKMIDTQIWLNTHYNGSTDVGDTISFGSQAYIQNRGKYNVVEQMVGKGNVQYYTDRGVKINTDDKPRIHVECDGWDQAGLCAGGCTCDDGSPCGCSDSNPCSTWTCHACLEENIPCTKSHHHDCEELLAMGPAKGCHDHTECDSQITVNRGAKNVPCVVSLGASTTTCRTTDHHQDCGMNENDNIVDYNGPSTTEQTDDCHEKYGCNILEFLYHNPGEKYGGYEVKRIYMVIQVVESPKEAFDINKWKQGDYVVPDKANLLQQVSYNDDGFVQFNWKALTDNSVPGSLGNPDYSGYDSQIHHLNATGHSPEEYHWNQADNGVTMPIGNEGEKTTSQSFNHKTLFGIFTLEGDQIRSVNTTGDSETLDDTSDNSKVEDFQLLESIRNRVGLGKGCIQPVNGTSVTINQASSGAYHGSELKGVRFDTGHSDAGWVWKGNYGYGEVAVTGSQHQKDPTPSGGQYGLNDVRGADGKKGVNGFDFGNSLLREIIGDQHVAHVRFGTQDPAGLANDDDNGRDFVYYVNNKKYEEHLNEHNIYKTQAEADANCGTVNEEAFNPDYYQKPGTLCPCGCGKYTMPEDISTATAGDWLGHPDNSDVGGEFVNIDEDKLYYDYYNNAPTDKKYFDELKKKPTDDPKDESGRDNVKLKELVPSGADTATQISNSGPTGSLEDGATNGGDAGNGDYRLWVTHASRGTRGMMTQYLNFKGFFHDAFDTSGSTSKNYCYMLFKNIKRSDTTEGTENGGKKGSCNADGDIDLKEDFVYANPPGDAVDMNPRRVWGTGSVEIKDDDGNILGYKPVNFSDTYGQGANSHWKALIDIYNAAMSETRHFD